MKDFAAKADVEKFYKTYQEVADVTGMTRQGVNFHYMTYGGIRGEHVKKIRDDLAKRWPEMQAARKRIKG